MTVSAVAGKPLVVSYTVVYVSVMLPYTSGDVCDALEVAAATLGDVALFACTSGEGAEAASAEVVEAAVLAN